MTPREDQQRRTVYFSGSVQGVGFRYRTLQLAERFSVTGFVRNLSDGRVEVVMEGDPEELGQFVSSIQQAMSGYIHDAQVTSSPGTGEFDSFGIR